MVVLVLIYHPQHNPTTSGGKKVEGEYVGTGFLALGTKGDKAKRQPNRILTKPRLRAEKNGKNQRSVSFYFSFYCIWGWEGKYARLSGFCGFFFFSFILMLPPSLFTALSCSLSSESL